MRSPTEFVPLDRSPKLTPRQSILIAITLIIAACGQADSNRASGSESGTSSIPTPQGEDLNEALDDLMGLPYAGFVDEEDDVKEGLISSSGTRWYRGYTLYSLYSGGMAMLVNPHGDIVHHWSTPMSERWAHTELMPNGELLTAGIVAREGARDEEVEGGNDLERRFALRMKWNGEIVWRVHNAAHHEMTRNPDGGLVTLTARGRRTKVAGEKGRLIRDNVVTYLDEAGQTVRNISLYNMIAADSLIFPLKTTAHKEGDKALRDLIHANAIEWLNRPDLYSRSPLYGRNNVVLSMRHQDRIAIFDLEQEKLLWAWGLGEISGPHDVQLLESGNLLLLDNGVEKRRSRVIEVDPVENQIVWEWQAPTAREFFTRTKGAVQRLPNGNTLVTNADHGEIFEIAPDGDVVWRFVSPMRNAEGKRSTLHRARRFESEFIEDLISKYGANPYEG